MFLFSYLQGSNQPPVSYNFLSSSWLSSFIQDNFLSFFFFKVSAKIIRIAFAYFLPVASASSNQVSQSSIRCLSHLPQCSIWFLFYRVPSNFHQRFIQNLTHGNILLTILYTSLTSKALIPRSFLDSSLTPTLFPNAPLSSMLLLVPTHVSIEVNWFLSLLWYDQENFKWVDVVLSTSCRFNI